MRYLLILLVALSSCYTWAPPKQNNIETTRLYKASYDEVWESVIEWFAKNNIPIKNVEKASGLIAAERVLNINHKSDYADCGQLSTMGEPLADANTLNVNFNVVVKKKQDPKLTAIENEKLIEVSVNVFYDIKNPTALNYEGCFSKGKFEQEILNYINAKSK